MAGGLRASPSQPCSLSSLCTGSLFIANSDIYIIIATCIQVFLEDLRGKRGKTLTVSLRFFAIFAFKNSVNHKIYGFLLKNTLKLWKKRWKMWKTPRNHNFCLTRSAQSPADGLCGSRGIGPRSGNAPAHAPRSHRPVGGRGWGCQPGGR